MQRELGQPVFKVYLTKGILRVGYHLSIHAYIVFDTKPFKVEIGTQSEIKGCSY